MNSLLKVASRKQIGFLNYGFYYILFKTTTRKPLKMSNELVKYLSPLKKTWGLKSFIIRASFVSSQIIKEISVKHEASWRRGCEGEKETDRERKKETTDSHSYSKCNHGFRSLVNCHLPNGDFLDDSI